MGTMDGLALVGGQPANFLDGGGGANLVNARLAIETLNRDPDVKSIFVNTFGGITQTDVVAQGIIDAVSENQMTQPIVVRVKGTGSEKAKETVSIIELVKHQRHHADLLCAPITHSSAPLVGYRKFHH